MWTPEYERLRLKPLQSAMQTAGATVPFGACMLDGSAQSYNIPRLETVDWFAAEDPPSPRAH
eukprot:5563539-Amphidinium_carterae.1